MRPSRNKLATHGQPGNGHGCDNVVPLLGTLSQPGPTTRGDPDHRGARGTARRHRGPFGHITESAVGASDARSETRGSNSLTLSSSWPIETLVIRSSTTSTITGTRYSAASFLASSSAGAMPSGSKTRIALQPSPSATLTWSTP